MDQFTWVKPKSIQSVIKEQKIMAIKIDLKIGTACV